MKLGRGSGVSVPLAEMGHPGSMTERAPLHLVARLGVIEAHVRQLAKDRGLEDAFATDLSAVARGAELARSDRSKDGVEAALRELRALARRIAAAAQAGPTLTDPRGGLTGPHAATLPSPEEPERDRS